MIRLCEICGKPIYSWDKARSSDYGEAVHNACFGGLLYRLDFNRLDPYQRIIAIGIAFSMKGEKNEWYWQRNRGLGLQPRSGQ